MPELLAPAGSMEALHAAVQNGADAVYLGASAFNARMGAKNFTEDELKEAVAYCHVRGVKVHLTLNTLVSDKEMPEAFRTIRLAAKAGVDAFIVQDLGVVSLCREAAPDIPVHASTQMSIHSLDGVRAAAALGISRVVLARELPKSEIAYICKNSPVEIEVFVHGALCMCNSGQCYLSGMIGQRSGNRGQCAQPCRMAYGYGHYESRYPLSLKDNCLIPYLRELQEMGVASLKIEGRAKRPEYVATVVRIYRSALNGNPVTKQDMRDLNAIFSRQGFTDGYYTGKIGANMFGTRIDTREDPVLLGQAQASYENGEHPRVPVTFYCIIRGGEPVQLAVEDDLGHRLKATGFEPEKAIYHPLTHEELTARLKKTGGTPYYAADVRSSIDPELTVSAANLNALRRELLSELTAVRSRVPAPNLPQPKDTFRYPAPSKAPTFTVSVLKANQVTEKMLKLRPSVLYIPLAELCENPGLVAFLPPETELCVTLPRVIWDRELSGIEALLEQASGMGVRSALVGNLGQILLLQAHGFQVRGDFGLNLYNSRSMNESRRLGLSSACCSFEMTLPQIRDLSKAVPTEMLVYGRLPLMLMENCVIRNKTGICSCEGTSTKLVDRMGEEFPIVKDPGTCRNVLLNGKKLYLLDKQATLKKLGIWAMRLSFTTESSEDTNKILSAFESGAPFENSGFTRGLYQRGV